MSYDRLPIDSNSAIEELRSFHQKDNEERKKGSRALLVIQTIGGKLSLKVIKESEMGFWSKVSRFFFPKRYQLANIKTLVNRVLGMESTWEQYYSASHTRFYDRKNLRDSLLQLNEKLVKNPLRGPLSESILGRILASSREMLPAPAVSQQPTVVSHPPAPLPDISHQPLPPSLEELKSTAPSIPIHGCGITNGMNRCYFNSTLCALVPLLSFRSLLQDRAEELTRKAQELEVKTSLTLAQCSIDAGLLTGLHKELFTAFLESPHSELEILEKLRELYSNEREHIATTLTLLRMLGESQPITQETPERIGAETVLAENVEPPPFPHEILEKFSALTPDQKRDFFRWPALDRLAILQQEKPDDFLNPVKESERVRIDQSTLESPFLDPGHSLTTGQFLALNGEDQNKLLPSFLFSPEYAKRGLQDEIRHTLSRGFFPQNVGILGRLTRQLQEYIDLTNRLTLARPRAPLQPLPKLSDLSFRDYRERDVPEFLTFFLENLLPSFSFTSRTRVEPIVGSLPEHVRIPKFSRLEATSPESLRCDHSIPSYFSLGFPARMLPNRSLEEVFQPHEHKETVVVRDVVIEPGASPDITPESVLQQLHANEGTSVSLKSALVLTGRTPPPLLTFHLGRFSEAAGGGTKRCDRVQIPVLLHVPHIRDDGGPAENPREYEYVLRSVVIHSGRSITFGHYYTYEPDLSSLQPDGSCAKWVEHNDTQVRERSFFEIKEDLETNGYVAFYEKRVRGGS